MCQTARFVLSRHSQALVSPGMKTGSIWGPYGVQVTCRINISPSHLEKSTALDFPGSSDIEESVGDPGSIPGSGRFPGKGNGNPLQCSCLENPMN